MDRILSREASVAESYAAMEKLKIGIIGISGNAGASFVTGCFARYLANTRKHTPAVVELGRGSLFDSYGMDKRFAGREYFHFYKAVESNKSIRGMKNMDEGINWILQSPEEEKIKLTFEQKLRLESHAKGDVILCDLSGDKDQTYQLLQSMDQVIAIIDPMPSKMFEGYEFLRLLKAAEADRGDIIYVINKINRGVNKRQMLDFLKIREPVYIPLVSTESIYTAEYNCRIPYTMSEVKSFLRDPFTEIASRLNF
ncbi:MAG: hypothetical protein AAGU75_13030 [Bacillota bacterium]